MNFLLPFLLHCEAAESFKYTNYNHSDVTHPYDKTEVLKHNSLLHRDHFGKGEISLELEYILSNNPFFIFLIRLDCIKHMNIEAALVSVSIKNDNHEILQSDV